MSETRKYVIVKWEYGGQTWKDAIPLQGDSVRVHLLIDEFVNRRTKLGLDPADVQVFKSDRRQLDLFSAIPDEYFYDPFTATATMPPTLWVKLPSAPFGFPSGPAPSGVPPTTPISQRTNTNANPPPSAGTATPNQTRPKYSPSNSDGKIEGLNHASDDSVKCMQATSHPACIKLLRLYDEARKENKKDRHIKKATKYVAKAMNVMNDKSLPDIGSNERFFTGAMTKAMNAVLGDGYVVTHQECLGIQNTHSDISACRIEDGQDTRTVMVGETKWNRTDTLRNETRGQIFNKLLRHRKIDSQMDGHSNLQPILLLAFDKAQVEIDLAFPSTKDGHMERSDFVGFSNLESSNDKDEKIETFWTVTLLRISISSANRKKNLTHLLRFLPKALNYLSGCPYKTRMQHKMPFINEKYHPQTEPVEESTMYNDNVTVITFGSGNQKVYKEYCYHLRGDETETKFGMLADSTCIQKEDQRKPPPRELLRALGSIYESWKVEDGPFGTSVLEYDFIEGSPDKPTAEGWLMILKQIQSMHSIGYVHGDLLPQNVIFTKDDKKGYVIDLDLARKEDEPYVSGLNYSGFSYFRHRDIAHGGGKMKKDHDVHALRQMSRHFFDMDAIEFDNFDDCTLVQLIEAFNDNNIELRNGVDSRVNTEGKRDTGSPLRSH